MQPVSIFIAYSRTDDDLRKELETHLSLLRRQKLIDTWFDGRINLSEEWNSGISQQLESAAVMLLLVSADFINSEYIWDVELRRAMERQAAGELRVIPILLRPCDWRTAPFSKVQGLPRNFQPVTTWSNRDEAWVDVVRGLRSVVESIIADGPRTRPGPSDDPKPSSVSNPGAASAIASPFHPGRPIDRDDDLLGRATEQNFLEDALRQGGAVEILGERRMGKTSLLRWVERHAGRITRAHGDERPVASISLQRADVQSPTGLVRAAAAKLGRSDAVEQILECHAGDGESRAAASAIPALGPAVLLVDEADGLLRRAAGFDDGVLDALRAAGQSGQLVWISVALDRLRDRFVQDGLTSSFLNDSRVVTVGHLDEAAAHELLREGLAGRADGAIDRIWRTVGGFAYGLQALGDAAWRQPDALGSALDLAADDLMSTFERFWLRRGDGERRLLRRALDGLEVDGLSGVERRQARRLVARGLLREVDRRFEVAGELWAEVVEREPLP